MSTDAMTPQGVERRIDAIIAVKDDPEDSHGQADLLFADLITEFCPKWVHDQLDRLGNIPNTWWYA